MTKRLALFGIVLALLLTAFVAVQYVDNDSEILGSGDFAAALHAVRPLAEQGDADAQYFLGKLYENGRGVRQNYAEAAKWYRKAAEQSHAEAKKRLTKLQAE